MPEVEYTTTMTQPPEVVWDFVKDMDNWAPFLTGYQKHEKLSDTDSIWTLKGDVGVLVRAVRLKVHVTEWNGPARVAFTMTGIDEEVEGGGILEMSAETAIVQAPPKKGLFRRMMDAIARFFFRLKHGKGPKRKALNAGQAASRLKFTLRMDAGGASGPLVNAMLGPALLPAAEDLGNKIAAKVEELAQEREAA